MKLDVNKQREACFGQRVMSASRDKRLSLVCVLCDVETSKQANSMTGLLAAVPRGINARCVNSVAARRFVRYTCGEFATGCGLRAAEKRSDKTFSDKGAADSLFYESRRG